MQDSLVVEAIELSQRTLTLDGAGHRGVDPRYGLALAFAALCCMRLCLDGTSTDAPRLTVASASRLSPRRALRVAGDDPGVIANAAFALASFGEDIGAMMALVDRALALNPNFARGWLVSGTLRLWAGEPDTAIVAC